MNDRLVIEIVEADCQLIANCDGSRLHLLLIDRVANRRFQRELFHEAGDDIHRVSVLDLWTLIRSCFSRDPRIELTVQVEPEQGRVTLVDRSGLLEQTYEVELVRFTEEKMEPSEEIAMLRHRIDDLERMIRSMVRFIDFGCGLTALDHLKSLVFNHQMGGGDGTSQRLLTHSSLVGVVFIQPQSSSFPDPFSSYHPTAPPPTFDPTALLEMRQLRRIAVDCYVMPDFRLNHLPETVEAIELLNPQFEVMPPLRRFRELKKLAIHKMTRERVPAAFENSSNGWRKPCPPEKIGATVSHPKAVERGRLPCRLRFGLEEIETVQRENPELVVEWFLDWNPSTAREVCG